MRLLLEMCSVEGIGKKGGMRIGVIKGGGGGASGGERVEKLKKSSRMKVWIIRATTSVLLWTCIVQLTALGETWGPRVLKGCPSCFSHQDSSVSAIEDKVPSVPTRVMPPKSNFFSPLSFYKIFKFLLILNVVFVIIQFFWFK